MEALKLVKLDDRRRGAHDEPKQMRAAGQRHNREVKFNLYGEEVIQKTVTASGSCGRVYLPLAWVGKKVKIIRVD